MTANDFTTTIVTDQSPLEVFKAITNVAAWWQGEIKGSATQLNDEFVYQMEDIHLSTQKVVELVSGKKVVWLVTESNLSFTKDQHEWTGTKIVFEISRVNEKTEMRFTHRGLVPTFECYGACENAWTQLIQKSLLSLITTGKGKNVF